MTLKVWIINHFALAPNQAGGTRHYTMARYLQQQDMDVTIFASSVAYSTGQDQHLENHEKRKVSMENGVRFVWLKTPSGKGGSIQRILSMFTFLQRIATQHLDDLSRPDIIIGSSPHLFAGLGAYILSRKYDVPFVLEVRDIWPKSMVELLKVSPKHPFIIMLATLERFLYRQADLLVSVLQGAGKHANTITGEDIPFIWVPNGVNLQDYPAREDLSTVHSSSFSVFYTGAHGVPNSLDTALKSAHILQFQGYNYIKFTFVGEGVSKANLIDWANRHNLKNVHFVDPIPKHEMPRVLAEADALLLLWRNSNLYSDGISPNKLFDYFAAAKPIVHAIRSPFDPVADAAAGLTISPEDPQALADALVHLSQLPEAERQVMGQRGRAYVEQHHDMQALALKLGTALWALVGRGSR